MGEGELHRDAPDIESHGRVSHVNKTWDRNSVLRSCGALRIQEDLGASNVELWICWTLVRLVQCENFGADEIVSSSKVVGNVYRQMTVIGDEFFSTPLSGSAIVIFFKDLEPAISYRGVCGRIINLLHVDRAWALVVGVNYAMLSSVRPVTPLEGQL